MTTPVPATPGDAVLDVLPSYPRSSRYHDAERGVYVTGDGTEIPYTRRRLLPRPAAGPGDGTAGDGTGADPATGPGTTPHTVSEGERPDLLAHRYLGSADQWWRIADANPVTDPEELTATPGAVVAVPVPGGFPGVVNG